MKVDNSTSHKSTVFDAQVRSTIPYYDNFHQETLSLVKSIKKKPRIWLDTGCGTGTLILKAIRDFPNTRFLLADPSRNMLIQARKKLARAKSVSFLPPTPTEKLASVLHERPDVITAIQAHHYLSPDKRQEATRACYEILNDNGLYVTFENIRPLTESGIKIGKTRWYQYQIVNGRSRKTAKKHLDRFDKGFFPITIEEHLELYRKCQFNVVELFWYSQMQAGFYCQKL